MWKAYTGEAQGLSHEQKGIPCQDIAAAFEAEGCRVIVLADGAGSASLSHLGAQRAASTAGRYLAEHFDGLMEMKPRKVREVILRAVREEIRKLVREEGCAPDELASTLLAVAVRNGRYLIVHLGDGVVGCMRGGRICVLSHPTNGEYANETVFTTSPNAAAALRLIRKPLGTICGFVLMSDGPEAGLYDKQKRRLSPVTKKIIRKCSETEEAVGSGMLRRFLRDVMRKKTGDDCSIAVLADPELIPGEGNGDR